MLKNKRVLKKLHIGNRGSAMITALIVSIVVFMFCLTALVVSYSLFSSSAKKVTQDQCRELAKSVSKEIQSELEDVDYGSYTNEAAALSGNEDTLWHYLRYNICQDSWPYYDADTDGHDRKSAYRYFKMNVTGGKDEDGKSLESLYSAYTGDISVCIYWKNDKGDDYAAYKEDTYLYVKVTCTRGDESSTITSKYKLSCVTESTGSEDSENSDGSDDSSGTTDAGDSTGDSNLTDSSNSTDSSGSTGGGESNADSVDSGDTACSDDATVNPDENTIYKSERWKWMFVSRK